jgi:hypothetical protein
VPRPGKDKPFAALLREGVVRITAPASVARLRWSDYLERNRTATFVRTVTATLGNRADWLATDAPVPFSAFRSLDVWYRGAWVGVGDVTDEEFAAYLAEPPAPT